MDNKEAIAILKSIIIGLVKRDYLLNDIPDFIYAIDLLNNDMAFEAANHLLWRDTIVRDEIPSNLYEWFISLTVNKKRPYQNCIYKGV